MKVALISPGRGDVHVDASYSAAVDQQSACMGDIAREYGSAGIEVVLAASGLERKGRLRNVLHRNLDAIVPLEYAPEVVIATPSFGRLLCKQLFGPASTLFWIAGGYEPIEHYDAACRIVVPDFQTASSYHRNGMALDQIFVQPRLVSRDFAPISETGAAITVIHGSALGREVGMRFIRNLRAAGARQPIKLVSVRHRLTESQQSRYFGADEEPTSPPSDKVEVSDPTTRQDWIALYRASSLVVCLDDVVPRATSVCHEILACGRTLLAPDSIQFQQSLGRWHAKIPCAGSLFDLNKATTIALDLLPNPGSALSAELSAQVVGANAPARLLGYVAKHSSVAFDAAPAEPAAEPAVANRTQPRPVPNVVLIGRFSFTGGYGSIVKSYESALRAAGVRYVCIDSKTVEIAAAAHGDFWLYDAAERVMIVDGPTIVLVCETAPHFANVQVSGRAIYVGVTLFETHSLPASWLPALRVPDEIWVPTEFNLETFEYAGVAQSRLRKVPYPLEAEFFAMEVAPIEVPGARSFKFLYVMANFSRKDLGLLIRSYMAAFTAEDDVSLVVKVLSSSQAVREQIERSVGPHFKLGDPRHPDIQVIQGNMTNDQLRGLYAGIDVYVSTERAKGWDYPAMEALSAGKPVVAVDWSGSTEFLDESNAYLIPAGELTTSDPAIMVNAELYLGQAYPDIREQDVAAALRRAFDDVDRRAKGERGRSAVTERYDNLAVGRLIKTVIEAYGPTMYRSSSKARIALGQLTDARATGGQTVAKK